MSPRHTNGNAQRVKAGKLRGRQPKSPATAGAFGTADILVVCIAVLTLFVYADVIRFDFVGYDDRIYVTENVHIRNGLSRDNAVWAATAFYDSNWFPLTLISHMVDIELYGLRPGLHHMNNVLFHTANAVLLFYLLRRLLASCWMSAFIAVVFALHPVHVESVAWVSERKDVLSAFFWIIAMLSYVRYAARPKAATYFLFTICFVLALMAKPMPVTFPFVLLLLDYWPMGRIGGVSPEPHPDCYEARPLKALIVEKVPLFIISALSAVVTLVAQKSGNSVVSLQRLPFGLRLENAAISYVKYISNTIYPYKLSILYLLPPEIPPVQAIAAAAIVILISIVAIGKARKLPYLFTGWFWFLGTLVPVIGLVQVGGQAMADRYNYMPSVGLFIIAAAGVPALLKGYRRGGVVIAVVATLLISFYTVSTKRQLQYWSNSITLFKRAIDVTTGNKVAYYNLGIVYAEMGRYDDAIKCYENALRISPTDCDTIYNLGLALMNKGLPEEAAARFKGVTALNPRYVKSYVAYGNLLLKQNRIDEAMQQYQHAIEISPELPGALNGVGVVMALTGNPDGALGMFDKALSINPDYAEAANNKKGALALISKRGPKQ
ncbi:MAG: tetratricopeptide repeat protein [Nitrospirae bacterium]|nr:tetratricopeptide repeat protein [Nitrospirota bacterium]